MNAKSPYVKLSMLKTINKPKAAAGDAIFDARLFFCLSAVNETASGFRWVLFPAFGQHKEVMLLKHKCPSPRIGKKPRGNIGRWLYAAFLTATLSASLCQPASAATVWEKANEIMRDVYTQILGISTIAAIVIPRKNTDNRHQKEVHQILRLRVQNGSGEIPQRLHPKNDSRP